MGTTQDGGLSIHMLSTASAQIGQHTTVPNLGLLTKDGMAVPLTACFALPGAASSDQPLIGVSAADGTLLTVSGQSVVSVALSFSVATVSVTFGWLLVQLMTTYS